MKKLPLLALLFLMGAHITFLAQKPKLVLSEKEGWHKLGEITAGFDKDHDEILVLGNDRFAALVFKVSQASIHLNKATITYENGDTEAVNLDFPVRAPGESDLVNIRGGERRIKKITFDYKTLENPTGQRSHVEIWGLKTTGRK